jgi:predicted Zn finger-like uncharacterized protein
MLVKCPKCKTTYKVSEEVFKGVASAFRCSRCKHTFELDADRSPEESGTKAPAPEEPAAITREDRELSFAFAPKEEPEPFEEEKEPFPDTYRQNKSNSGESKDRLDQWSMSGSGPKADEAFAFADTRTPEKVDKTVDSPDDAHARTPQFPAPSFQRETGDNILPLDPYRDQQTSIRPYLTLFGLLVISYSLVAVLYQAHPQATEGVVRKIPLVGSSVLRNSHLKNGVVLQSLGAGYQSIQGNRDVFVITGVALNQNPIKIRDVRVTGQLYNQDGKEIEQQTVWIGNAISAKIVRGMTAQDISDLQRLPPLKSFDIPPGDSVPFTIVFLRSPKGIKDFSCAVVAAEGEVA